MTTILIISPTPLLSVVVKDIASQLYSQVRIETASEFAPSSLKPQARDDFLVVFCDLEGPGAAQRDMLFNSKASHPLIN